MKEKIDGISKPKKTDKEKRIERELNKKGFNNRWFKSCAEALDRLGLKKTKEKLYQDPNIELDKIYWKFFIRTTQEEKYEDIIKLTQTIIEEKQKKPYDEEIQDIKDQIYDILTEDKKSSKKKDEITEILATEFQKKNTIYTLRSDEKTEMWIYNKQGEKKGILTRDGESYIKEFCRKILGDRHKDTYTKRTINKVETDTYTNEKDLFDNKHPYKIAVKNGILNLKTKKLTSFDETIKLFTKIPVKYDPSEQIYEIKKFIGDIVKKGDRKILQEMVGATLCKEYLKDKCFMLLGEGSNGKSILISLIKHLLGVENCASVELQKLEKDGFAVSNLHMKLVNLVGDLGKKTLQNTAVIKKLTGDLIQADRKYLTPVKFKNYANLISATNNLPKTYDHTDGFFRRWKIINFPYKFLKENDYEYKKKQYKNRNIEKEEWEKIKPAITKEDLLKKLLKKEELRGMLNWALEGLQRVLKKGFSDSQSTEEKRNEWLRQSSSFTAFCMDHVKETDMDEYITKKELKSQYSKYCRKHRVQSESTKAMKAILSKKYGATEGRPRTDEGHVRVYYGILLDPLVQEVQVVQGNSNSIKVTEIALKGETLGTSRTVRTKRFEKTPKNHSKCYVCGASSVRYLDNQGGKPICKGCMEHLLLKSDDVEFVN